MELTRLNFKVGDKVYLRPEKMNLNFKCPTCYYIRTIRRPAASNILYTLGRIEPTFDAFYECFGGGFETKCGKVFDNIPTIYVVIVEMKMGFHFWPREIKPVSTIKRRIVLWN